ncbi:MAG: bifunctional adenosylcobinamide kinase/adenosylcobinamide-phosphate guanylyltransferase [Peptostreptococcaceae bacterium]
MSKLILVTGGSRSGKSSFAEILCKNRENSTAYIATSTPFDEEMKDRVRKHKESRPSNWKTYEIYKDIYTIIKDISNSHQTVILDCVTLLVNNLMFEYGIDFDNCTSEETNKMEIYIKDQIEKLIKEIEITNLYFVIVTNELGMSLVPDNKLCRVYSDIVGRINQYIAKCSDEVYFVVSGIPMKIKE